MLQSVPISLREREISTGKMKPSQISAPDPSVDWIEEFPKDFLIYAKYQLLSARIQPL